MVLTTGFWPIAQALPDAQSIDALGRIGGLGAIVLLALIGCAVLWRILAFISGTFKRIETMANDCHAQQAASQENYQTQMDKTTDRFLAHLDKNNETLTSISRNVAELTMNVKDTKRGGG